LEILVLLGWVFSKNVQNVTFLARKGSEDMPIILAGDFNISMKDNYDVEFVKDTFELVFLSDLSQGMTRSNSCIDVVFG
jgi:hypothetical protein